LLIQEETPMSRRPSDSCAPRSDATNVPVTQDPEKTSTPSLESLLASCGALQAALRKNGDSEACSEEVAISEPMENAADIADELHAEEQQQQCELPRQESELSASSGDAPSETTGWIDSLRLEFRASIDELKAAQSSAAASQSAVLKTLTEIIFQSSTVRDGSNGGLEQKLAEFEDRILNRISQIGGLTTNAEVRRPAHFPDRVSNLADPVIKNPARSWAEIRHDLVMESESDGSGFKHDPVEMIDFESASTGEEAEIPECECIVEVPQAVDPETLDEQELRAAFYEREEFIAKLISRLRHQYQKSNGHLPAEQLKHMAEHLPQELAAQVLQTLEQLNELARVGELELSLERARLAITRAS
jgi:hypothetical protein